MIQYYVTTDDRAKEIIVRSKRGNSVIQTIDYRRFQMPANAYTMGLAERSQGITVTFGNRSTGRPSTEVIIEGISSPSTVKGHYL